MSVSAVALGLAACGAAGAGVPALVRAIPEPEPADGPITVEPAAVSEHGTDHVARTAAAQSVDEGSNCGGKAASAATRTDAEVATAPQDEPKSLYADLGARRGLGVRAMLLSGLAGALVAWSQGWSWTLLVLLPLVPVMVALAVVDWNTRLLPTWVIRPTYYLTVALVLVAGLAAGDAGAVIRAAAGWLVLGALYGLLWFVNSGGLGYGDVRLSGVLGLAGGFVGWAELLTGAWSAFLLGGVIGGVLALLKVVDRKAVPFGPFMVLGALVGLLVGPGVGASLG